MVFNSLIFALFFAMVSALYFASPDKRSQKIVLTIASYFFYGYFYAPYVLILLVSTAFNYFVGLRLAKGPYNHRGYWMFASLLSNLGMLAFFKYSAFIAESISAVAPILPAELNNTFTSIILPIGISYYTFQTMSYNIDIYRKNLEPTKSLLDFSFFVSFFPQLVAGPIVRAADFLPQAAGQVKVRFNFDKYMWGLSLLVMGLFGKVVLADTIAAPVADDVFANAADAGFAAAWVGTLAFSAQIFFDFSGYSLAAIGVALSLGYTLPDNFRFPYAATGFSDFWRRWHISLSTWLRDYLYISLGGNRSGTVGTYRNLCLTMLLGGLWHGAAWTFVVWGALHGGLLVAERLAQPAIDKAAAVLPRVMGLAVVILATYICVCFTWVFFRATNFADAWAITVAMASPWNWGDIPSGALGVVGVTLFMLSYHALLRKSTIEDFFVALPAPARILLLAAGAFLVLTIGEEQRAFIYFQF